MSRPLLILSLVSLLVIGLAIYRSSMTPTVTSNWRGLIGSEALAADVSAAAPVASGLSGVAVPQGRGFDAALVPAGNPLRAANTVMTQGYGVGSHAPAHIWGAIDLALDGNGDGRADPEGTWNQPVYATHAGTVKITRDSWPAGNHIWVVNDYYRTGYAHLGGFAVSDGQWINPGDLIGYIGSTGMSSGPHLDYQVWIWRDGQWVNQNPLDYGVFGP